MALDGAGEHLTGSTCDPACPPCARCMVEDERTLRELAPSVTCDCSALDGRLGFDPDVPCGRDCYFLLEAVRSCPHKVCSK